jgi:hypothetical protein
MLNNRRRWSYANHNLRIRRRRHQSDSKQQCQCNFFHDESSPPGVLSYRNPACGPARCTSQRDSAGIVAFHDWRILLIEQETNRIQYRPIGKMQHKFAKWSAASQENSRVEIC